MKYTCDSCGTEHSDWPALTFNSPDNYNALSQTDRFIRCVLIQKVNDYCEDLEYGLWVSLSEKSFTDYSDNFNNENHETSYFGWLCNDIPDYAFDACIPTTVYTQTGNRRPEIVPHSNFDHPFVKDYYNGITKQEAEKRIFNMMQASGQADAE